MDETTLFANANDRFKKKYESVTNLKDFKLNIDFIRHACMIVENLYDKKTMHTSKKDLAVNMLKNCLQSKNIQYTEDELKQLNQHIDSLHAQGKIKKIRTTKRIGRGLIAFFFKFLGL